MSQGSTSVRDTKIAALFGLRGDSWQQHSNPVSVWTRFAVLPMLAAAVWSRTWLGWFALIPFAISVGWLFANPLFFKRPRSTRNWASKSVLGEHIWVDRAQLVLPPQFTKSVPTVASLVQVLGFVPLVVGLINFRVLDVITGLVILQAGKLWYLDRMVLLFEDMKTRNAEYAAWEY